MKTKAVLLLILILTAVLVGCSQLPDGKPDYQDPTYRWSADLSQPGEDLLVRGQKIDQISGSLDQLIDALNGSELDPESFRSAEGEEPLGPPKLKLIGIEGNQALVEIINARYLTQRMGSTGADAFLAEATFTITEHPGIDMVYFQFEEGDHASPGLYSRENFTDHWKVVEK